LSGTRLALWNSCEPWFRSGMAKLSERLCISRIRMPGPVLRSARQFHKTRYMLSNGLSTLVQPPARNENGARWRRFRTMSTLGLAAGRFLTTANCERANKPSAEERER
jgi:hypothetical protein